MDENLAPGSGRVCARSETRRRVLIVEDHQILAHELKENLRASGYEVVGHATTAKEAISLAQRLTPDLILMDIVLDGPEDGIFAATKIGQTQDVPLLFLTGLGDEATLQRAKLANPFGYLLKPFQPDDLRAAIEIALHRFEFEHQEHEIAAEQAEFLGFHNFEQMSGESDATAFAAFLERTALFRGIPAEIIARLAQVATLREMPINSYHECGRNSDDSVGFVVTGRLAMVCTTTAGKELIVALLPPGGCYGIRLLTGNVESPIRVRSQLSSKFLTVPIPAVRAAIRECPELAYNLSVELADRLARTQQLASSLAHSSVENRLVSMLLTLIPEFGKPSTDGPAARIFITRKDLADLIGTTPETAIRVTKSMEREGLLDLSRPGVIKIADPKRLAKYLK